MDGVEPMEGEVWSALAGGDAGRVEELTRDLERVPVGSRMRRRLELARVAALKLGGRDDEAAQTLKAAWDTHLLSDLREELDGEPVLRAASEVWAALDAEKARIQVKKRKESLAAVAGGVILVVVALGGCYLTMFYPSNSKEGKTSTRFVRAVGSRDLKAAGDLLSTARKSKLGSQNLLTAVPARMNGANDLNVNGIESRTRSGVTVSCIEGWLEYPEGTPPPEPSKKISFKLVEENGTLKIDDWSNRWCRFNPFWN